MKPLAIPSSIASMAAAYANIYAQSQRANNAMQRQIILISRPFGPWRRAAFAASLFATLLARKHP